MRSSFCVFILSHGRPENVKTVKTLKDCGYSGDWRIVIDDEDDTAAKYASKYGDRVVTFCKSDVAKTFDEMDTSTDRRSVVYARNACFEIAEKIGVDYFLELDDDYTSFEYRWQECGKLKVTKVRNLDKCFESYLSFLDDSGAVTVAMAQGGDLIGGCNSKNFKKRVLRKAMNSFFCKTKNPFKFVGRVNEDVNTYVSMGMRGELFMTAVNAALVQMQTQANPGGMADMYNDDGTYMKSFYTVMAAPSCVKVQMMGDKHRRIHHHVEWEHAVPKIMSDRWRKNG